MEGHPGSQQLRSVQRTPSNVLRLLGLSGILCLLVLPQPVQDRLHLGPAQIAEVCLSVVTCSAIATLIYRTSGDGSRAYLFFAVLESVILVFGVMWLIFQTGHADTILWLPYVAGASINGGVTEHRRLLTLAYTLPPALLALSFWLINGDLTAACFALVAGAFAFFVFLLRSRSALKLDEAVEAREQALLELAELRVRDERTRIARDLHDGLGADLAAVAWRAQRIEHEVRDASGELQVITARALQGVDELRSVVWALRTPSRPWGDLVAYLSQRCQELCASRATLHVHDAESDDAQELSGDLCITLIRIAQESVRNALRHGNAKTITISLQAQPVLRLRVEDDGAGIPAHARTLTHGGLANLKARARELGGTAEISSVPGRSSVQIEVPRRQEAKTAARTPTRAQEQQPRALI